MAAVAQQQVTISYQDVKVTLDGKEIVPKDADGNIVEPFLLNGTVYLPIRGIASALGLGVGWDSATNTAQLTMAADEPAKEPVKEPAKEPAAGETMGQKNALAKAKSYLSISSFSYQRLVAQLEFEKFSHEDAVYGADNCGADWNEQAAKKAKSYLSISAFSREAPPFPVPAVLVPCGARRPRRAYSDRGRIEERWGPTPPLKMKFFRMYSFSIKAVRTTGSHLLSGFRGIV